LLRAKLERNEEKKLKLIEKENEQQNNQKERELKTVI
jgi:hypothetical protein